MIRSRVSPAPKTVKASDVKKLLGRLVLGTDQVRIVRRYVEALEEDHKVMRETLESIAQDTMYGGETAWSLKAQKALSFLQVHE